ncbi:ATP synthase F1 subunit epsilon [Fluviispira multicolorata]|uniref:ATP synthase epsilon chain n=1 Tax=Fluviispira multicolorata TaxID=2654512 RepID=A0A833JF62_9BACT|nr:ATP synthase F1 subunit epsilon [Fluviispira multicolorata]KAB8030880.1 ATP synthase F1 subunit epsilon [Fluviispira multicolorata]
MIEAKDKMRVVLLTPSKRLLDLSGVSELYFPSEHGAVGVLPGHAPMVTAVGTGVVLYSQNDVSGFFKVAGGVAEITCSSVTLLVDVGEEATTIDLDRAKRALERAEGRLAAKELGNVDVKRAETSLARAQARIEAVELHANKNSKEKKSV